MPRTEFRWRVTTAVRANAQRAAARIRPPRWHRRDILRAVEPALRASIRSPAASNHWQDVHDRIAARVMSRPARFVLDPSTRDRLRRAVLARDPDTADRARARADRIVGGEYDVLGYRGLRFAHGGHRVDWHFDPVYGRRAPRVFYTRVPYLDPVVGDHKIIWEINRHQHWLALGRAAWLTGDGRYAAAIVTELHDWLEANPPLVGINWASMLEVALRALSWTWALHCLLGMPDSHVGTRDSGLGTGRSGPWAQDRRPGPRSADPDVRAFEMRIPQPESQVARRESRVPGPESRIPDPGPWLVDMLVGLARQLTHVEQNLSFYFSPNTHLTGEALALYVAGAALPELAGAQRWMTAGRRILLDEIARQILPDGGHAERSAHYHRYTLDFYVLALLTARLVGDDDAALRFADATARLAEFARVMADDDGRLPLIGDDDGGMLWPIGGRACTDVRDSLATAAIAVNRPALAPWGIQEETIWLAGPGAAEEDALPAEHAPVPIASRAFDDSGYVVLRGANRDHAVFDTGAHGYQNAGHAHADALAVTLTLAGRPLLIDAGTGTYTMDARLRDRLRGSESHNTITVDGRSSSAPAGPFHWQTRTDARLEAWRRNGAFDFAEAAHEGYSPLRHRRALIRIGDGGWFIADEIAGGDRHTAAALWHFDPAWALQHEARGVRAVHTSGDVAWLLHDASSELLSSDHDSGLGWYAPVYGTLVPAPAVRVIVEGHTPLRLMTWIGGEGDWQSPVLSRVAPEWAANGAAMAAEIVDGRRRALLMLRLGGMPGGAGRDCRVAGHETDARLLHCMADGERLVRFDLIDVTRVISGRHGWLSLEAEAPFADLHCGFDRGFIDLRASMPAATLRLNGVPPSHRVRLNGREYLGPPAGLASASLLVHPSDWHTALQPQLLRQL